MKFLKIIVLGLAIINNSVCFGQFSDFHKMKIDSISQIINTTTQDTSLAKAYLDLSDVMYMSNIDTVIKLCEKAIQVLKPYLIENSISQRERISYMTTLAGALNNIGFIYDDKGDITKALDYYHKALKIREKIGDKHGIAETFNNIGIIYINQGDYNQALDYYHKSLKVKEDLNDKKSLATTLNNIGAIYRNQQNIDMALSYYNKSLTLREEINDKAGIAVSLSNIGTIYKAENKLDSALIFYQQSLAIRQEINDKPGLIKVYSNLSDLELEINQISSAKNYAMLSLNLAQELGLIEGIRNASRFLSEAYRIEKNWEKAFMMQELYHQMKDSIRNTSTELNVIKQQSKYELERAEQENELLVKENDIQHLKTLRNRIIAIFFIVAFIFTLIIIFYVYRGYRKKVVINELLQVQKNEAQRKNEEKNMMLKEIHHRVKNSLQVVSSLIRLQANEVDDERINKMFEETQNRVLSIARLHEQMYNSENLKEINIKTHFTPLVKDLIKDYNMGTKINLVIDLPNVEMSSKTLIPLGLIINEMISNSLKYAFVGKAEGSIMVTIKHLSEQLYEMIIGDDGIGMPKDFDFENSTSLGTQLIHIFTDQLNGSIKRLDKDGTFFRIEFEKMED
ncbi:MAG: tetratricopeptide repeat protein [Flavobacteriales bacterium]